MVEIPTRTLKMAAEITLQDFWQLCNQHDWSFQYSDDHRQWEKGRKQRDEIQRVLKYQKDKEPKYRALFDRFSAWAFDAHGDTTKPEKPE